MLIETPVSSVLYWFRGPWWSPMNDLHLRYVIGPRAVLLNI